MTDVQPIRRLRPDIQGLRGVAVGVVLVFHLWPQVLPGGYIGVDVFFVISGYLITSLLLREVESTGRIDFTGFYVRRALRLLPAATLVLAAVALLTPLLLPADRWVETAAEVIASALYVENWQLAHAAVDYLAAENAPSPVQHYWSLSVEEQFYVVWPALIALVHVLAARLRLSPRRALCASFLVVVAASLAVAIVSTRGNPGQAYFFSHARVWELGVGGVLAAWRPELPAWARRITGSAGLVAIFCAALMFSGKTAFPGHMALIPVLGAVAVLAAGSADGGNRLLAMRPLVFLGDISYSLYLWHWPLIVFHAAHAGRAPGAWAGMAIAAVSIGLAWLGKRHVEDRYRHVRGGHLPAVRYAVVALVPVAMASALLLHAGLGGSIDPERHPGARVLAGAVAPAGEGFVPALEVLKQDRAAVYDNGCHLAFADDEPVACHYGDASGRLKVWLVGDSHAVNWLPAFEEIAERRHWNASSYTKSSCGWMPVMVLRDGQPYRECRRWGQRLLEVLERERPDVVVLTQMHGKKTHAGKSGRPPSVPAALRRLWHSIEDTGAEVVVIADTPRWKHDPGRCLARDDDCAVPLAKLARGDSQLSALSKMPQVGLVDMNDVVCPDETCPMVVGNVVVWRDRHHLTASYSRSASDILEQRLVAASKRIAAAAN